MNRVQYQEYDVTKLINKNSRLDILLAEGWGGARVIAWPSKEYPYFYPSLIFSLEIIDEYGRKKTIVSDENLDVYTSHILESSIYNGEIQDINREIKYVGKAEVTTIDSKLVKQEGEDIVEDELIYPQELIHTPKGELVVDFGQNFTGYINIKISSKKGEKISFIPADEKSDDLIYQQIFPYYYNINKRKIQENTYKIGEKRI